MIRSGRGGKTLKSWSFYNFEETNRIIDYCIAHEIAILGEGLDGTMIWFGKTQYLHRIDAKTRKEIQLGPISDDPHADFNIPMLKLTLSADSETLFSVQKYIAQNCPSLHPVISGAYYLDITAQGINKGTGLHAYAEICGFQPFEIAAIGDQEIDLYMMHYAGLPIAMKNGVQKVKDAAKWIAPSNDEEGVAWALDAIRKLNQDSYVN